MYTRDASFCHGVEGDDVESVKGHENIEAALNRLDYGNCRAEISHVSLFPRRVSLSLTPIETEA